MINKSYQGLYFKESAIYLQAGKYEAIVLPEIGGNLIAFRDTERPYFRGGENENRRHFSVF